MRKLRSKERGDVRGVIHSVRSVSGTRAQFPGNSPVPVLSLRRGHVPSVEVKGRPAPSVQHAPRKLSGEIQQLGKSSRKKKDGDGTESGGGGVVVCSSPALTSVIIHPRSELDHGTANWISPRSAVTKRQRDLLREPWPQERIGSFLSLRPKMEGRMLGKRAGPGCSYSPRGSLSRGNRSVLWTERWKLYQGAERLTSSAEHWVTTNGDSLGPRRGKHPLKPRSAFHLAEREREREGGTREPTCPRQPALLVLLTLRKEAS